MLTCHIMLGHWRDSRMDVIVPQNVTHEGWNPLLLVVIFIKLSAHKEGDPFVVLIDIDYVLQWA